tara:strand:+ start:144 stop:281 length:138 start_codon:yes stop_codon:yes gene_type:complete
MKEYNKLYNKLQNNTITKSEKDRLYVLAFGEDFMNDKNSNKKWRA